jgi:hypothetical protein
MPWLIEKMTLGLGCAPRLLRFVAGMFGGVMVSYAVALGLWLLVGVMESFGAGLLLAGWAVAALMACLSQLDDS